MRDILQIKVWEIKKNTMLYQLGDPAFLSKFISGTLK